MENSAMFTSSKLNLGEQEHLKCPRCESMNTKFCYFNNYSLSQPRYFCKNCKRYWTKGGSLHSIPVGGKRRRKNSKPTNDTQCSSTSSLLNPTESPVSTCPNPSTSNNPRNTRFTESFSFILSSHSNSFSEYPIDIDAEFFEASNSRTNLVKNPRFELQNPMNPENFWDQ